MHYEIAPLVGWDLVLFELKLNNYLLVGTNHRPPQTSYILELPPTATFHQYRIQNCKPYPSLASFLPTAYDITALPRPLSPPAPSRGIQNLHGIFSHPHGTLWHSRSTFSHSRTFTAPSRTLSQHLPAPSRTFATPRTILYLRGTFSHLLAAEETLVSTISFSLV
ncbi:hypothetical protein M405DRAFT_936770 [Rhizopogon salebrosus TDB-379]|nr:hypothetical protein M405DRAFT_936770 [Rhizopogon salebrosus TDB-379]